MGETISHGSLSPLACGLSSAKKTQGTGKALKEIGECLGLTRERVPQIDWRH